MALAFARTLLQPCTAQTINSAATFTSAQQDIGADTIGDQLWAYLEIDGFAAAPVGTMEMGFPPVHTAAGAAFDDAGVTHPFTVAADQLYQFGIPLSSVARYFKETVFNNTTQHTDANATDSWVEVQEVTA